VFGFVAAFNAIMFAATAEQGMDELNGY